MPYCITLRSRTDARITGWYDGSDSRWSTDRNRQKVFDRKSEARPVCYELRSLCPRNAEVINIEAELDHFSLGLVPAAPDRDPLQRCQTSRRDFNGLRRVRRGEP
jgi:hypothetical protein